MPLSAEKITELLADASQLQFAIDSSLLNSTAKQLDEEFSINDNDSKTKAESLQQRTDFAIQLVSSLDSEQIQQLMLAILKAEMQRVTDNAILRTNSLAQSLLVTLARQSFSGQLAQELVAAILAKQTDLSRLQSQLRDQLVAEDSNIKFIISAFQLVKEHCAKLPASLNAAIQAAHFLLSNIIQTALAQIILPKDNKNNNESLKLANSLFVLSKVLFQDRYLVATTAWLINGRQAPAPQVENFPSPQLIPSSPQQNWERFDHASQAIQAAILGKAELLDILIGPGLDERIRKFEIELQDLMEKRSLVELDLFIIQGQLAELNTFSKELFTTNNADRGLLQRKLDTAIQTGIHNFSGATTATLERGDIIGEDGSLSSGKQGAAEYIVRMTTELQYTDKHRIVINENTNVLQLHTQLQSELTAKTQEYESCFEKSEKLGMARGNLDIERNKIKERQGRLIEKLLQTDKANLPAAYQINPDDMAGKQAIVGAEVPVNACESETGNSLLHLTVLHGHVEATKLLLKRRADILLLNKQQQTAIHFITRSEGYGQLLRNIVAVLKSTDLIYRNADTALAQLEKEMRTMDCFKQILDAFGEKMVEEQQPSRFFAIFHLAKESLQKYCVEYEQSFRWVSRQQRKSKMLL
jgi:hypothetical protein